MGEMTIQMKKEMKTEPTSSSRGSNMYTKQFGNIWRKFKNNIKLDTTNTGLIISSRLETRYGFTSTRKD
jgi:hypothetical protein